MRSGPEGLGPEGPGPEGPCPESASPETRPLGPWRSDVGGTRLVFEVGGLARLAELLRELGVERPLVVSDPGLVDAGHVGRAADILRSAGLETAVFTDVEENPTTDHVRAGAEVGRAHRCDGLVGLGGGSAMDCAKGINVLLGDGGPLSELREPTPRALRAPLYPSVGVPTTAGTGSDAQSHALISDAATHRKMACGAKAMRFRTVLLDPELLASLPHDIAAVTAMDALSHAVESAVCTRRNPVSRVWAREAWTRLDASFEAFLADRSNVAHGANMLLAAHFSGAAIENSMLGIAHSCANPLTAHHGVTHGVAVGLTLPTVVRFNARAAAAEYEDLAAAIGRPGGGAEAVAVRIEELRRSARLPASLAEMGIEPETQRLASEAASQWTAAFNPRSAAVADLRAVYEAVR